MNTITIPRDKYAQILNTQEKLQSDLSRLQKIVFHIAQDEVTHEYAAKLSKIEKGLSSSKCVRLKNKNEIKKFFRSL